MSKRYDFIQSSLNTGRTMKKALRGSGNAFARSAPKEHLSGIKVRSLIRMISSELGLDHDWDDSTTTASSTVELASPRSTVRTYTDTHASTTHSSTSTTSHASSTLSSVSQRTSSDFPLTEKWLSETRNTYLKNKSRTPWATDDDDGADEDVHEDTLSTYTPGSTFSVSGYTGGRARVGMSSAASTITSFTESTQDDSGSPSYLLLDVRDQDAYEACHITTASHYPKTMLRQVNWITPELFRYKNRDGKKIVLYSLHDKEAEETASSLADHGIDNVYVLRGGLRAFALKAPSSLVHGDPPELTEHERDSLEANNKNKARLKHVREAREARDAQKARLQRQEEAKRLRLQAHVYKERLARHKDADQDSASQAGSVLRMSPRKYSELRSTRQSLGASSSSALTSSPRRRKQNSSSNFTYSRHGTGNLTARSSLHTNEWR